MRDILLLMVGAGLVNGCWLIIVSQLIEDDDKQSAVLAIAIASMFAAVACAFFAGRS